MPVIAAENDLSIKTNGSLNDFDNNSKNVNKFNLIPVALIYSQQEGLRLKSPTGVFCDKEKGEIYVADTNNNMVAVYNKKGAPVYSFGYNNELFEPSKVMVDKIGRIYVLTGSPRVVKIFNYRGDYISDFEFRGMEKANSLSRITPTAMTADSEGNLYFGLTNGTKEIIVYDQDFNLILRFGKLGMKEGEFTDIADIAVDKEKNIYVADSTAIPVQVFNKNGRFINGWGEHSAGPDNFSLPSGIAVTDDEKVIVVDQIRQDIKVFTKNGDFIGEFGGYGYWAGATANPVDVDTDSEGHIFVVERVGNRLQIFGDAEVLKNIKKDERRDVEVKKMRQNLTMMMKEIKKNDESAHSQIDSVRKEIGEEVGTGLN